MPATVGVPESKALVLLSAARDRPVGSVPDVVENVNVLVPPVAVIVTVELPP